MRAYSAGKGPSDIITGIFRTNVPEGIVVSPASVALLEGGGGGVYVRLAAQPTSNVLLSFARTGTRYTISPANHTFTAADWNTDKLFSLDAPANTTPEGLTANAPVNITATGSDPGYSGRSTQVAVSIDDPYLVNPLSVSIAEGGTTNIGIRPKVVPDGTAIINAVSSNPAVATVTPGSLSFNNSDVQQFFTVSGVDNIGAGINPPVTITFSVDAATFVTTQPGLRFGLLPSVAVTVTDNDFPGFTINPLSLNVNEASSGVFTIRLNTQPAAGSTTTVSIAESSPLVSLSATSRIFTDTNWNIHQVVTVISTGDNIDNDNITIPLTITATSTDLVYHAINPDDVSVNYVDDDTAAFSAGTLPATINEGSSSTFPLQLASEPTANVTVTISSSADGSAGPASHTFTSANWNSPITVVATATNDAVDDGNRSVTVSASATSADPKYNSLSLTRSYTSVDDDTVGVSVSLPSAIAEGNSVSVDVVLTSQPASGNVVIECSEDNAQTSITPASRTFTTANWNVTQSFTITATSNGVPDIPRLVNVTCVTNDALTADPLYDAFTPPVAQLNLVDGLAPEVLFSWTSQTLNEGASVNLTVSVTTPPSINGDVLIEFPAAGDVVFTPNQISFSASDFAAKSVTVSYPDDYVPRLGGLRNFQVNISDSTQGGEYAAAYPFGIAGNLGITLQENDQLMNVGPVLSPSGLHTGIVPLGDDEFVIAYQKTGFVYVDTYRTSVPAAVTTRATAISGPEQSGSFVASTSLNRLQLAAIGELVCIQYFTGGGNPTFAYYDYNAGGTISPPTLPVPPAPSEHSIRIATDVGNSNRIYFVYGAGSDIFVYTDDITVLGSPDYTASTNRAIGTLALGQTGSRLLPFAQGGSFRMYRVNKATLNSISDIQPGGPLPSTLTSAEATSRTDSIIYLAYSDAPNTLKFARSDSDASPGSWVSVGPVVTSVFNPEAGYGNTYRIASTGSKVFLVYVRDDGGINELRMIVTTDAFASAASDIRLDTSNAIRGVDLKLFGDRAFISYDKASGSNSQTRVASIRGN